MHPLTFQFWRSEGNVMVLVMQRKKIDQTRGRARTWSLLESTTWPLGLGVCGLVGALPDLWVASPAPRPRLPDFRVASFWRCSARVVALHLYLLTFALGPCLNHEGEGDPSGCLPEISSSSGLVKVWGFRRRFGVRAVGPFLPFQSSESWARTHRAPARALSRSGSSRYSPPALPWAPPPSDLNQLQVTYLESIRI